MTAAEYWQDVVWQELGYVDDAASLYDRIKGREEFRRIGSAESFIRLLQEQMKGVVIKNGLISPNLPLGTLWHATNTSNLPGILDTGLRPQKGKQSDYAGLTIVEGPEGYVDLPCTFFAQHPDYAVFKRGIRGSSDGPLALLEINWHKLRARGYKIFPAHPDGYPVNLLSPREDLENAIERGEHGKLEIACYETIGPEPEVITGVYVDERATIGYNPEFRVVAVKPITGDFRSWRGWNRAVVEASYSR